ncbi:MAG: hypothetical protein KC492_25965 [Myxococcales bacterium]|nr:hypothetical protein [Myxococcales bacterium]MCB9608271.1 hypothetical protein [Polyangiaceae bacterium]
MSYHDLTGTPSLLAELPEAQRAQLLALWQSARQRQHAHLRAAIEEILSGVPLVLRGAVRKILL